jgi:hypothetical protein
VSSIELLPRWVRAAGREASGHRFRAIQERRRGGTGAPATMSQPCQLGLRSRETHFPRRGPPGSGPGRPGAPPAGRYDSCKKSPAKQATFPAGTDAAHPDHFCAPVRTGWTNRDAGCFGADRARSHGGSACVRGGSWMGREIRPWAKAGERVNDAGFCRRVPRDLMACPLHNYCKIGSSVPLSVIPSPSRNPQESSPWFSYECSSPSR